MASRSPAGRDKREYKGDGSSKSKRRKESTRSSENTKHGDSEKKFKKKRKRGSDSKLKVRSVSELAELVTSGAVQVPKSLNHYQNDRFQLLDQVFTILSPDDVEGMLPDILKGLKIKEVRELCYEQLKNLSEEQITKIICNSESSPVSSASTNLCTSSQSEQVDVKMTTDMDSTDEGIRVLKENTLASNENSILKDEYARKVCGDTEGEAVSNISNINEGRRSCATNRTDNSMRQNSPSARYSTEDNSNRQTAERTHGAVEFTNDKDIPVPLKEDGMSELEDGERMEDDGDMHTRSLPDKVEREGEDPPVLHPPVVPETAHMLEMELRRRAVEADLKITGEQPKNNLLEGRDDVSLIKKSSHRGGEPGGGYELEKVGEKAEGDQPSLHEDIISVHPMQCDGIEYECGTESSGDGGGGGGGGQGSIGELLEDKLRQRALEAMMARKKNSKSQNR